MEIYSKLNNVLTVKNLKEITQCQESVHEFFLYHQR